MKWRWGDPEESAFKAAKELLTSADLLVHYNPEQDIVLACDASSYGVGAVLAHKLPDGTERPIGYASRSLSSAEKNYSQLGREGLACVFSVKRFHSYLFGRPFELVTDHKPLLALLHPHRFTSEQASGRIHHWSLFLSTYEYTLRFRKTEAHGNADALSRLPRPKAPVDVPQPAELVLLLEHLEDSPVTVQQIAAGTRNDPTLGTVLQYVRQGWPEKGRDDLAPYFARKHELSVLEGCVLWGARVVVPPKAREAVLAELHEGHPGMTRMKQLARMYVWWPGIQTAIERCINACTSCQMLQPTPPAAPLQPWKWPTRPWARLHLDFAGPLFGKMFLVLIDAHSKWIEVFPTTGSTSAVVIDHLRTIFAQFGLPETLVTDNGSCFVSAEFSAFALANRIKHITSAPYHPSTNVLAERAVQIVKKGSKKVTEGTIQTRLARVLMAYRLTPHTTTGMTPAELLLGRQPRTKLDMLKPHIAARVEAKQRRQKADHDSSARSRAFIVGTKVYAKNFGQGPRWLAGEVTEVTGPVSFLVTLQGNGRSRHQDHLRLCQNEGTPSAPPADIPAQLPEETISPELIVPEVSDDNLTVSAPASETVQEESPSPAIESSPATPARYPSRNRRQPDWLDGPRRGT